MSFCRRGVAYLARCSGGQGVAGPGRGPAALSPLARYAEPRLQKLMMLNTVGKHKGKGPSFPQRKMPKTSCDRITCADDAFWCLICLSTLHILNGYMFSHLDVAGNVKMSEEKSVVAAPPPPAPDLGIIGPPPKRKKGRPPKNRALIPSGESSTAPVPPKPDGRGRKRKNGDVVWPAVDSAYVGQQVHGVLDGSFDAGYLLTVRVGNTQTVLRGAVFEPSLSVPISQSNDIAPNVKFISRGELAAPPLPCITEHANASVALPSPFAVPPANPGNNDRAPIPMEEEKRPPSVGPSVEPSHVPSGVATEGQKDTASPLQSSDHVREEKMHSQVQPHLRTV